MKQQKNNDAVLVTPTAWITHNFIGYQSREELDIVIKQRSSENVISILCNECDKRPSTLYCQDCNLVLCLHCADAIHIVTTFSWHSLSIRKPDKSLSATVVPYTERSSQNETNEIGPTDLSLHENTNPNNQAILHLTDKNSKFAKGSHIYFRSKACARWPNELLHGTILHDDDLQVISRTSEQYYRILYLRGVERLPNGFFRANLSIPLIHFPQKYYNTPTCGTWPKFVGIFSTQLAAFRAVVTTEKLARMRLRDVFIRANSIKSLPYELLSEEDLETIVEDCHKQLVQESKVCLTANDDRDFHAGFCCGRWTYTAWMTHIGRKSDLSEEQIAETELLYFPGSDKTIRMPWTTTDRIKYIYTSQNEIYSFEEVLNTQLKKVVEYIFRLYMGAAWSHWHMYTQVGRSLYIAKLEQNAAMVIQRSFRHWMTIFVIEKYKTVDAVIEKVQYQQKCALSIYGIILKKIKTCMRFALGRWQSLTIGLLTIKERNAICFHYVLNEPNYNHVMWHPSHDITCLPKLARTYAHKTENGLLKIEDIKRFNQFRFNHTGPTQNSYFIIRQLVLAGSFPLGPAFHDARRVWSRTDALTSILVQGISAFICLLDCPELNTLEISKSQRHADRFASYEDIIRGKYEELKNVLEKEVRSKHSRRITSVGQSIIKDVKEDNSWQNCLISKREMNDHVVRNAKRLLSSLQSPLKFIHFPIPKDEIPKADDSAVIGFLVQLENLIREGRRIYIFSMDGHGRTGLIAALLLGRLYGLSPQASLDRAQQLHDCQMNVMHQSKSKQSISSPKSRSQVALVHRLLAPMDAIYQPIALENSDKGVRITRVQRRGLAVNGFAKRQGFIISDIPTDDTIHAENKKIQSFRQIVRHESLSLSLRLDRKDEALEKKAMAKEDLQATITII